MVNEQVRLGLLAFASGVLITLGTVGVVLQWSPSLWLTFYILAFLFLLRLVVKYWALAQAVKTIRDGMERLTSGDFSEPITLRSDMPTFTQKIADQLNKLQRDVSHLIESTRENNLTQTAIMSGLNEGVISTNQQGVVRSENALAAKLLHVSAEPNHLDDHLYLRGVNYNYVWNQMVKSMKSGESHVEEINISGEGEQRVIEVYTAPLDLGNEEGALAVLRDVTHVKQLERLREDFVANVSHELKTPLTSIRGYIDLLRSHKRKPQQAEQFYEIIEIEADRLQLLIDDLLELSEIQAGDVQRTRNEQVYLYQTADEVLTEIEPLAAKMQVTLHLEIDPDLIVRSNRSRMKQLFTNLVSNAVKYNKPGGEVWVRANQERDRTIIEVKDNGIGIPPEDQARIFERFYSVSKSRSRELGGTGLGLAIVKHIAGLYGGSVSVDSEQGRGTSFTVVLPL